jgi:hypothetical protein
MFGGRWLEMEWLVVRARARVQREEGGVGRRERGKATAVVLLYTRRLRDSLSRE